MFNVAASKLPAPLQRVIVCIFVNIGPKRFIFVLSYSRWLCGSNAPSHSRNGQILKEEFHFKRVYMNIPEKSPLVPLFSLDERPGMLR